MAAAQRIKAFEKQRFCKQIVTVLKKRYRGGVPKAVRPALETILYAACLENASAAEADSRYERLGDNFHDLNEIRVSSISELSRVFDGLSEPERRAMRIRSTLQYVFEKHYEFDFETIRRKTFDSAERQLGKIKGLSPFVRAYTLQAALGSHIVPVDQSMCNAAVWLGLVEPKKTVGSASEALKSAIRKADVPQFCHLLRQLANDPILKKTFESAAAKVPEGGFDLESAPQRLDQLFKKPTASKSRRAAKKSPTTKKKMAIAGKTASRATAQKTKKKKTTARKTASGSGSRSGAGKKTKKKTRATSAR